MRHIGIDINSSISTKTVKYNFVSGSLTKVTIIYDSPSNTLTAVITYENGQISTISQKVDLKAVLPKDVSVGFSATSTIAVSHNIHSWSFTSNLEATTGNIVSQVNTRVITSKDSHPHSNSCRYVKSCSYTSNLLPLYSEKFPD
ncbi:hypothetical protein KIW84_064752 [Lathyrus oleraceus]|uniref:Legume lectin domain-containing protein n=1 Tax=Pisum sativum TaxID=3888 RepID=A0A9D4WB49_PEA|nr:hypothetical protein KIW84_064752 [Pisum sativum]